MEQNNYIVAGFQFPNGKEALAAKRELEHIKLIREKTDFASGEADADTILELYTRLIEKNIFKTQIGYSFLGELRNILIDSYNMQEADLPVVVLPLYEEAIQLKTAQTEAYKERVLELKGKMQKMKYVIIALAVMIIGMFILAATNKNVGYINTENKILDKYASWEEELNQREKEITERERALENSMSQ